MHEVVGMTRLLPDCIHRRKMILGLLVLANPTDFNCSRHLKVMDIEHAIAKASGPN
jgi:hypothetical protein